MSNKWYHTSRGKTSEVSIYSKEGYVIKQFRGYQDPKKNQRTLKGRGTRLNCFLRELECLRRLRGHEHFPQLLDHDQGGLWIKMSYCGTPYPCDPPRPNRPDLVEQANRIVDSLAEVDIKYDYKMTTMIDGTGHEHLQAGNLSLLDDRLYLLDFETAWPVGAEIDPLFGDRFRNVYTKQEFKQLFRKFLVPTGDRVNDLVFAKYGNKRHVTRKIKNSKR